MTIEVKNPNKKFHLNAWAIELSKLGIKIILSLKTLKSRKAGLKMNFLYCVITSSLNLLYLTN